MDKFVHKFTGKTQLTRKDIHSSVIRRHPDWYKDASEKEFTKTVDGFCECGWPYTMLLPRGTKDGEEYLICVVVTDNIKDMIEVNTKCGSMSYCGSSGLRYPDRLQMGYPFTSLIERAPGKSLVDALKEQPNVALVPFVICNSHSWRDDKPHLVDKPISVARTIDLWPNPKASRDLLVENPYSPSFMNGVFRVHIRQKEIKTTKSSFKVEFAGRGKGNGTYTIKKADFGQRQQEYMRTDPSSRKPILADGHTRIVVPESGMISDPISVPITGGHDYYITFTLEEGNSGSYRKTAGKRSHTMYVRNESQQQDDFSVHKEKLKYSSYIYCVKRIIA